MKFVLHIRFGSDEIQIASDDATELSGIVDALQEQDDWYYIQSGRSPRSYYIQCRNISYMEIRDTETTVAAV
jgi:hypothetical protein